MPLHSTFQGSPEAAFRVYINGTLAQRLLLNGDNLEISLPRWMLRQGTNIIELATAQAYGEAGQAIFSFGGIFTIRQGGTGSLDDDDVEFANVVLELPGEEEPGDYQRHSQSGRR
ncbi:MAG TPA: hypothetical protein VIJ25_20420 [Methylococcales bacterium]